MNRVLTVWKFSFAAIPFFPSFSPPHVHYLQSYSFFCSLCLAFSLLRLSHMRCRFCFFHLMPLIPVPQFLPFTPLRRSVTLLVYATPNFFPPPLFLLGRASLSESELHFDSHIGALCLPLPLSPSPKRRLSCSSLP